MRPSCILSLLSAMTYAITPHCIGCQRCVSACPTVAIQGIGTQLSIDESLCNQCNDSFGVPQCWAICPTNNGCVETITTSTDYWDNWFATYTRVIQRLEKTSRPKYWHTWFDRYAQALAQLQQPSAIS